METLTLSPGRIAKGEVRIPGSKSLSNRILLLAALAKGRTKITNLLDSDDIRHNLHALGQLGINFSLSSDKTECTVDGLGGSFNLARPVSLFLGNAGTAMRPLAAALTLGSGDYELTGEPRMEERPIGDLVDCLRQCGADIQYLKTSGYPPLRIKANGITGGDISIDGSISSQFLTAMLMAAPMASGDTRIHIKGDLVSKPYIHITLNVMSKFGVEVSHDNYQVFNIKGGQTYQSPGEILVEGDASSASYFLAAGALGGPVKVLGVGQASVQGDIRFADVLEKMGARITWGENWIQAEAGRQLQGVDLDLNHIPDAAMTLVPLALFANGDTTIRNIYNWRVKETDRLYAMATEMKKLGATVIEGKDFIHIKPPEVLNEAHIDTYNDHRVAMCFSLVSLSKSTKVHINDPECVAKTFPDYFELFQQLCPIQKQPD